MSRVCPQIIPDGYLTPCGKMKVRDTHHSRGGTIRRAGGWVFSLRRGDDVKTETKTVPPRTTPSCPACSMVRREVEALNVGLALGKSPRRLSRSFLGLSRSQIKRHRDRCLGGDALLHVSWERGWLDEPGEGEAVAT
jgi:hypothetical protein